MSFRDWAERIKVYVAMMRKLWTQWFRQANQLGRLRGRNVHKWLRMDMGELVQQIRAIDLHSLTLSLPEDSLTAIEHWSNQLRFVVLLLWFFISLSVSALVLWVAPWQSFQMQRQERLVLEARYRQYLQASLMVPYYQRQIDAIDQQFGELLQKIPASFEIVEVLNQIARAAKISGLELQEFKPSPEIVEDGYAMLQVDIQLLGSYQAVGHFLEAVSRMKHLLTVDVMLAASDTEAGSLLMTAHIKAYRGDSVLLPAANVLRDGVQNAAAR